jgi:hypothetical protein
MYKSESIGSLAGALSKAQAEIKGAEMNAVNPFLKNKYADLGSVIEAARPALGKNGLSFTQLVSGDATNITLDTIIMHESGEYIGTTISLPVGDVKGRSLAQSAGDYHLFAALWTERDPGGLRRRRYRWQRSESQGTIASGKTSRTDTHQDKRQCRSSADQRT